MANAYRLNPRFILSQTVTFNGTSLVVNLPTGSYGNREKYCIVLAQTIPEATTINAPVVFTIGTGTTEYPFVNCDCTPILASQVRTRRIYPTRVNTGVNDGVFKYIGGQCLPSNSTTVVQSIPTEEEA
ncbi:MAG: hypothetical protein IJ272_02120 [Clostridia bacterium]|nr:hypothetical protein [Clostridia bacterium]